MSNNNEPVKLTVSGILQDLQDGYTRKKDDKGYQGEGKSIQEKYDLIKSDVSRLFKHEKLKGRRAILPSDKSPAFILEDDTETIASSETEVSSVTDEQEEANAVEEISADTPKTEETEEASTDIKDTEEDNTDSWLVPEGEEEEVS